MIAVAGRSQKYLDTLITVPEAAALAGVSPWTMRQILDEGLIPFVTPRKHRRVRRGDVLAYLERQTEHGAAEVATAADDPLLD